MKLRRRKAGNGGRTARRKCSKNAHSSSDIRFRLDAVSIHAPTKEATKDGQAAVADLMVSIHAPAKGATRPRSGRDQTGGRFDPRPREGGDYPCRARSWRQHRFDPRPREGGAPPAYGARLKTQSSY